MRALAAGCLVAVALVITGCGADKDAGKVAVKTIEDDWEGFYIASNDPFPARPDLKGLHTIRRIRCDPEVDAQRMLRCTLVVGRSEHGGDGTTVRVIVRFDEQDVLREWKFAG